MAKFSTKVDDNKNDHQNKSIVLKESILDNCVDGTEFFLGFNTTDRNKSLKTWRKWWNWKDENDKIVYDKIDSMISSGSVVAHRSSMFNDDVISALQNLLIREHLDVKSSSGHVLGEALQFKAGAYSLLLFNFF